MHLCVLWAASGRLSLDGVGWRVMEVRGIEREFDEEEGNDSNDREKNRMGIVLESKQEGSSS
jgi:hypothetical protein